MIHARIRPAPSPGGMTPRYFVVLVGVPGSPDLVASRVLSMEQAQEALRKIEDELDVYRKPKRKGSRRKPKTSWERINRD